MKKLFFVVSLVLVVEFFSMGMAAKKFQTKPRTLRPVPCDVSEACK